MSTGDSFARVGFVLCRCGDRDEPDAARLGAMLEFACPGSQVRVVERPCRDRQAFRTALEELRGRALVVGACGDDRLLEVLREEGAGYQDDPWGAVFADLRPVAGQPVQPERRLAVRLRALARRALAYPGVRAENAALRLPRGAGRAGEGGVFSLVPPRYWIIPRIDPAQCAALDGCRFCRGHCPNDGLMTVDGRMELVASRCQGCGSCVSACPFGAVDYPTWSSAEIAAEVAGLLERPGAPTAVVIACRPVLRAIGPWPDGMEAVALPCLGRLEPGMILEARARGARVAIVGCPGICGRTVRPARPRRAASFARRVVEAAGRPGVVEWVDWRPESGLQLPAPPAGAPAEEPLPSFPAGGLPAGGETGRLPALARLISLFLDDRQATAGLIRGDDVPFGWLSVHDPRCDRCGACAAACPTGALRRSGGDGRGTLLFRHDLCAACGFCVRACPARAIWMDRLLKPAALGREIALNG